MARLPEGMTMELQGVNDDGSSVRAELHIDLPPTQETIDWLVRCALTFEDENGDVIPEAEARRIVEEALAQAAI